MDFNKFNNGGNGSESNTFEGDTSLNPYAGNVDNSFDSSFKRNINSYEPYRNPSGSSKGKNVGFLVVAFVSMFMFFGYAAYWHLSRSYKEIKKQEDSLPIAEGSDGIDYTTKYNKEGRASTKEELKKRLLLMIEDGEEDLYVDATRDISEEDVKEVCKSLDLDPFMYEYSGYTYITSTQSEDDGPAYETDDVGINVQIDFTIEGLVYESITNGKEIPNDNIKASKLKVSCETFLKNHINDSMTDYEKEIAVHDYLINLCDYENSNLEEKDLYSAYGVMLNKKAVCEGYSRATALLLKLCNVENKLITGKINDSESELENDNHMWNQVKIDGKWYHLDTTWDDPFGEHELKHIYVNLNDDILSKNHEWDRAKYESCTSMDANYYTQLGTYFTDNESFQTYVREQLDGGNRTTIECVVGDVDLSEEALGFIFEYEGIESYYLSWGSIEGYKNLVIHINGN